MKTVKYYRLLCKINSELSELLEKLNEQRKEAKTIAIEVAETREERENLPYKIDSVYDPIEVMVRSIKYDVKKEINETTTKLKIMGNYGQDGRY